MTWYKASVPVAHCQTQTGKQIYAPIYVEASNITHAEERIQQIPAVGSDKTAKRIVKMEQDPPDECITNPWYGYSEKFKEILNSN